MRAILPPAVLTEVLHLSTPSPARLFFIHLRWPVYLLPLLGGFLPIASLHVTDARRIRDSLCAGTFQSWAFPTYFCLIGVIWLSGGCWPAAGRDQPISLRLMA